MAKAVDITGQRFGRLTVIERAPSPEHVDNRGAYWRCKCDCGQYHSALGQNLRKGLTRSCGCLQYEYRHRLRRDLTGQRFGRLTALEHVPAPSYYANQEGWWRCKCDCGNTTEVTAGALLHGRTKSCGCLSAEVRHLSNDERKEKKWM